MTNLKKRSGPHVKVVAASANFWNYENLCKVLIDCKVTIFFPICKSLERIVLNSSLLFLDKYRR